MYANWSPPEEAFGTINPWHWSDISTQNPFACGKNDLWLNAMQSPPLQPYRTGAWDFVSPQAYNVDPDSVPMTCSTQHEFLLVGESCGPLSWNQCFICSSRLASSILIKANLMIMTLPLEQAGRLKLEWRCHCLYFSNLYFVGFQMYFVGFDKNGRRYRYTLLSRTLRDHRTVEHTTSVTLHLQNAFVPCSWVKSIFRTWLKRLCERIHV